MRATTLEQESFEDPTKMSGGRSDEKVADDDYYEENKENLPFVFTM